MEEMREVKDFIEKINEMVKNILSHDAAIEEFKNFIPELELHMNLMLKQMLQWKSLGIEIPLDIIDAQLENLQYALKTGDRVTLADVMEYEIKNTFVFYIELLKEAGQTDGNI